MTISMIAPAVAASTRPQGGSAGASAAAAGFGALIGAGSNATAEGGAAPVMAGNQADLPAQPDTQASQIAQTAAPSLPLPSERPAPADDPAPAGEAVAEGEEQSLLPDAAGPIPPAPREASVKTAPQPEVAPATLASTRSGKPAAPAVPAKDVAEMPVVAADAGNMDIAADDPGADDDGADKDGAPVDIAGDDSATRPAAQPIEPQRPATALAAAPAPAPVTADAPIAPDNPLATADAEAAGVSIEARPAARPAGETATAANATTGQAAPDGPDGLPSPLFSQALPGIAPRAVAHPYGAAAPHAPAQAVVTAEAGRIGREMGVEIARGISAGRSEVLIRLDPAEMGRIDVRLSFERDGSLRAVMAADSPMALDMLRRESSDLSRALADAGVRADAQSFRFDSRGGDAGTAWQRGQQAFDGREAQGGPALGSGPTDDQPAYRSLRASGRVDVRA
ncbi:flagellar hook-length control protein FliK, putative [Sphingomonas sp. MM-1]|uniref:flagellar hook-length control protein FliK n=1 Tax=Sphingomonas sp. MM-1 TaxID=745310 RepID=UPI0002C04A2C|nr:flagellar hook-length control protein FliK [Sphingomonas sp. MM-1]AGH49108.1 flagellar hook-length control protein FliK, putative [Sphingomonas sp. MM-1]